MKIAMQCDEWAYSFQPRLLECSTKFKSLGKKENTCKRSGTQTYKQLNESHLEIQFFLLKIRDDRKTRIYEFLQHDFTNLQPEQNSSVELSSNFWEGNATSEQDHNMYPKI